MVDFNINMLHHLNVRNDVKGKKMVYISNSEHKGLIYLNDW